MDFVIEEAERKAIPVMIGLYGLSGSGKTLSGLKLARGLAGPEGKIGVIDTENGRAQMYAGRDEIGGYSVISLTEPFQPKRFADAVEALENAGCAVIMVDSISAEWEGLGGVLDMADKIGGHGLQKWNKPKVAHNGMMQRLIRSSAHIIFNCRGKQEIVEGRGENGQKTIEKGDIIAIQDGRFIYEMTLHMRLTEGSNVPVLTKCIDELRPFINEREPLTVETGAKIAEWVNNGAEYDKRARELHTEAKEAAQGGVDSLVAYFASMKASEKPLIAMYVAELKATARAAVPPEPAIEDEGPDMDQIARDAFAKTDALSEDAA